MISRTVSVLSDQFVHARDMARQTSIYFDKMSSTVSQVLRNLWEKEITVAKRDRLIRSSIMDLMGAQDIEVSADTVLGQTTSSYSGSPTEDHWLQTALSVEELQCVTQCYVPLFYLLK
jgi:hypothetical protein